MGGKGHKVEADEQVATAAQGEADEEAVGRLQAGEKREREEGVARGEGSTGPQARRYEGGRGGRKGRRGGWFATAIGRGKGD